jgi:polyisoprenyl-phosphate glycosyltransferase
VYGDIVGARLLVLIAIALAIEVAAIGIAIAVRYTASPNLLSVTVYLAVLLGVVLLQAIPIALILVFSVIGSRVNIGFLPIRDCPYFVRDVVRLFPAAAGP